MERANFRCTYKELGNLVQFHQTHRLARQVEVHDFRANRFLFLGFFHRSFYLQNMLRLADVRENLLLNEKVTEINLQQNNKLVGCTDPKKFSYLMYLNISNSSCTHINTSI